MIRIGLFLWIAASVLGGVLLRTKSRWSAAALVGLWAMVPPIALILDAYIGMRSYHRIGPHDPGDAPGYVMIGVIMLAPVLWVAGVAVTAFGFLLGRMFHRPSAGVGGAQDGG